MLEAGFAAVAEFHYLHNDAGRRILRAPRRARGAHRRRRRSDGNRLDAAAGFLRARDFRRGRRRVPSSAGSLPTWSPSRDWLEDCRSCWPGGRVVGVAPHSLRAATLDEMAAVVAMAGEGTIHIHVAEQIKEVEDCLAWSGAAYGALVDGSRRGRQALVLRPRDPHGRRAKRAISRRPAPSRDSARSPRPTSATACSTPLFFRRRRGFRGGQRFECRDRRRPRTQT